MKHIERKNPHGVVIDLRGKTKMEQLWHAIKAWAILMSPRMPEKYWVQYADGTIEERTYFGKEKK